MKHLALLLFLASALSAQIFSPPGSVRRYLGTPTAGDCTASAAGRKAANIVAVPTVPYYCGQTSTDVWEWVAEAAGGGSGDVLGASSLTTAGACVYVSSSGTLAEDPMCTRTAAGRWQLYDSGGSGVSTFTVRAGLGQSSTSLQEWKTAAGSLVAAMSPTGVFSPAQIVLGAQFNIYQSTGGIIQMASANELRWQSTTSIFSGSPDLGIVRNAAGVAALTNGSSTNYWLMGSNGILPGADNTYDIGSTAASVRSVYADTDFIGTTTSFFYWGPTGSDGSWRMGLDSGSMVIQKRESGSWVTKSTLAP